MKRKNVLYKNRLVSSSSFRFARNAVLVIYSFTITMELLINEKIFLSSLCVATIIASLAFILLSLIFCSYEITSESIHYRTHKD